MLQLQRVGVSRLREPAADREGERDEEDGPRARVSACVRAYVCVRDGESERRGGGEKS